MEKENSIRFILVRHGETERNLEKRIQGQTDSPLSERGRQQSEVLARRLARSGRLQAVYSSNLGRALATAALIAEATGHEVVADERFRELSFGEAEGSTWDIINRDFSGISYRWRDHEDGIRFPGGESRAEGVGRALAGMRHIAGNHPSGDVVIVTHGGILASLFGEILQIPPGIRPACKIENASINILRLKTDKDRWKIMTWGDVSHLEDFA